MKGGGEPEEIEWGAGVRETQVGQIVEHRGMRHSVGQQVKQPLRQQMKQH